MHIGSRKLWSIATARELVFDLMAATRSGILRWHNCVLAMSDQGSREALAQRLEIDLSFELCCAFDAIVARQPRNQFRTHPLIQNSTDVFPCNTSHRGNVALTDFLLDDDSARADLAAECLGQVEQSACHAALGRQKTSGRYKMVGLAQTPRKEGEQIFVDLWVLAGERLECGVAYEAHLAIA